MTMPDGRYFAWVFMVQPWAEPKVYAQVIHVDFIPTGQTVLQQHMLEPYEYILSVDELSVKYPFTGALPI